MTTSHRTFDTTDPANDRSLFNARLLDFVRALEGVDLLPYVDSVGIATIGVGYNLRIVEVPDPWTPTDCGPAKL